MVPNPLWQPVDPPKKSDLVLDPLTPSSSPQNSDPVPPRQFLKWIRVH